MAAWGKTPRVSRHLPELACETRPKEKNKHVFLYFHIEIKIEYMQSTAMPPPHPKKNEEKKEKAMGTSRRLPIGVVPGLVLTKPRSTECCEKKGPPSLSMNQLVELFVSGPGILRAATQRKVSDGLQPKTG